MQAELRRALQKPMAERRWVMVIDLRKCVGCHACTIACVAENKLPPGVVYRQVVEEEIGTYPNVTRRFMPRPCLHCDEPPCVPVCPVNATYKRADGIVVMDYDRCIGCRYCMTACPYNSRYFDFGFSQYDETPTENEVVLGQGGTLLSCCPPLNTAVRSPANGKNPPSATCVNATSVRTGSKWANCRPAPQPVSAAPPSLATPTIPNSLVSELIAQPNIMRLREELGTEPKVYYLT
jgi:Fe-S-cluster-containing dehydrogenase component